MRQGRSAAAGRFFGKPSVLAVLLLLLLVGGVSVLATLNPSGATGGGSWNSSAVKSADVGASRDGEQSVAELNPEALLTCQVVDAGGVPLEEATCTFDFDGNTVTLPATAAVVRVAIGVTGTLSAEATGYYPQTRNVTVTADGTEVFGLFALPVEEKPEPAEETPPVDETKPGTGPPGQSGSPASTGPSDSKPDAGDPPVLATTPLGWQRVWREPIAVCTGCGYEPGIMGDRWGTIYYNPTNFLFRSDDGGTTWKDVSPSVPSAVPVVAGDTAVNVAPDGSLWWSRYWGYLDFTIGCRSLDRGNTWTCDNNAIPGITDRMWIAGVDKDVGYLTTGEALSKPEWAYTNDGSFKYRHPCAVYTQNGQTGNMVYDSYHTFPNPADPSQLTGKILVYTAGQVLWVNNPDGCYAPLNPLDPPPQPGTIQDFRQGFGGTAAISWLQVNPENGQWWSNSNPVIDQVTWSRGLAIGRSTDEGLSWDYFKVKDPSGSITMDVGSITMSYTAVGPQDLPGSHIEGDLDINGGPDTGDYMVTMFYGSDKEGPPQATGNDDGNAENGLEENMGKWSLYVATARYADTMGTPDPGPAVPVIQIEKLVDNVHTGNVCIGLLCENTGSDPSARFAGDLLGTWVDQQGLGHIAFQIDGNPMYTRQDWVYFP